MPINEFSPSSGLSDKQQNEALASIYATPTSGNMNISLTAEEYRVLQMLQAKAGNLMEQPIREFDLNKPPVVPYHYQEFPFTMYREGRTRNASNAAERSQLMNDGWSAQAPRPIMDTADDTEYPCLMFHRGVTQPLKANNAAERQGMLDDGWSDVPFSTTDIAELDLPEPEQPKKKGK